MTPGSESACNFQMAFLGMDEQKRIPNFGWLPFTPNSCHPSNMHRTRFEVRAPNSQLSRARPLRAKVARKETFERDGKGNVVVGFCFAVNLASTF